MYVKLIRKVVWYYLAISPKGPNGQTENFGNWEFWEDLNRFMLLFVYVGWFSVGRIIHDVFTAAHPEENNAPVWLVKYSLVMLQHN